MQKESRISIIMYFCFLLLGGAASPSILIEARHSGMITANQYHVLIVGTSLGFLLAVSGKIFRSAWIVGPICIAVSLSFGIAFGFSYDFAREVASKAFIETAKMSRSPPASSAKLIKLPGLVGTKIDKPYY